ncbi:MAG: exported protein of unknown function [Phycisphaerales bacterium]|nr:exported protein of unknown function [Phycisphaerales bacterium]
MANVASRKVRQALIESCESRLLLAANIIYVDANIAAHSPSAVHDGSSWSRAFDNLQSALTKAATTTGADQIWIAEGTYKPSQVYSPLNTAAAPVVGGNSGLNSPNLKTFNLPDNVALYGGFAYGAKFLSQQNPAAHPTILSGDLAGNDANAGNPAAGDASKSDNAWHVVTAGNDVTQKGVTASLDGLRIIDGYAAGPNIGGTLSPFVQGHADGGGVFSAFGSNLSINDSLFQYNFAASDGGGVFSDGSNLVATDSRFLNNSALVRAGGLEGLNDFEFTTSHTSLVDHCYFQDNTSAVFGGAIVGEGAYQGVDSSMTVSRSTFVHNSAPEGGAIVLDTLTVNIDSCTFTNNQSTVNAGAIATTNVVGTIVGAKNDFATTVTRSTFTDNATQADKSIHDTFFPFPGINFARGGGALVAYMNGYLNVDHCLFVHNATRDSDGGAILNGNASANIGAGVLFAGSPPITAYVVQTTITDSVFLNNQAPNGAGGAIASESDGVSPLSTAADSRLSVSGSAFAANRSSGNGGAIALSSSSAKINGNLFAFNQGDQGDAIFATHSNINGFASSDPQALASLKANNLFLFNDIVLL